MKTGSVKALFMMAACTVCSGLAAAEPNVEGMKQIYDFLKEAKCYYIATVDGDQPHVRPFGTILIFEKRLYIQTGRKKNVAKQLLANGKVELCAMKDDKTVLRVTGKLIDDPRREAKAAMLDAYPGLKKMYSPDDDNTMVLYFDGGTATITSFGKPPVTIRF